ncbi:glycoside hydrolase family 20 protein [Streptomyces sp. NPDC057743]|uniref:beta-N-acetylhexosaminidase n=1 Tax=Streptomyces sp. NPDC057743 TaxID=3346236 RepID=UPI003696BB92
MSNPMRPPRSPWPSASPQPPLPARPPVGPGARRMLLTAPVLAGALVLGGCSQGASSQAPGAAPSSSSPAAPIPSWAKVTGPPRIVPAVREFRPANGNGWRPTKGARIVVPAGEKSTVADEAQLMAKDLGGLAVVWGKQDVRPGDIEVKLSGGARGKRANNAPVGSAADESYTLTARDARLTLTAPTDTGVFNGTRTVKQAVRTAGGLPEGTIEDRPDRPQRGLMIDNARKPFTAEWIEARIRQLADLKLNQLQLHFSDDQGFRIQSDSHPQIVSADHLTKDQVRHLIKVGQSLHVALIPEIDSPGHLGAVLDHYPDLQLRNASGKVLRGAIDISKPQAGELVDSLLKEFGQLFTGPYWHLGGDEYQALMASNPEASYPQLAKAARDKYGSGATIKDLATGWLNDRQKTVEAAGKNRIEAWNDGFFAGGKVAADKNRTVAYWTGKEIGAREPEGYLREGRTVLNLNDEFLYYVLGEPNGFTYPTGERIYKSWTPRVLRHTSPVSVPESQTGADRIPGGRFAIWCDHAQAQTAQQIAAGIKLPLAALAQKTWDPRTPAQPWTDFKALANRL